MILVTGGAGFIGSNFILQWVMQESSAVVNYDKLTYAGNLSNLDSIKGNPQHIFVQGDIQDRQKIKEVLSKYKPYAVINFAAETHVDRSIESPDEFVRTNILGTFALLDESFHYWKGLSAKEQKAFRFFHISTDEVFGSLDLDQAPTKETSPYAPNSPYAASKAAADHLVRSYNKTYGFPTLISYCTNNFGPFQFLEKLIPLMTLHALQGKPLPVYGDGSSERHWIFVDDHNKAIRMILKSGKLGETYNIGDPVPRMDLEVVKEICRIMDDLHPEGKPHEKLIQFVEDRPGHDHRYSLDITKISQEIGWKPVGEFENNLRNTVLWYLKNPEWIKKVTTGEYLTWIKTHYHLKESS